MKNKLVKILTVVFCMITLATALVVPISATEEETTENEQSTFSITEGGVGTSVYTDLREMVSYTVYPDNINTTNWEERDGSNYYYELSLPVGTVVPWEYFSDMRAGSSYLDGKGQPSAIRAVVGYTTENYYSYYYGNRYGTVPPQSSYYEAEEKSHHNGFLDLYVYTVSATDTALNPILNELNPNASFYFLLSRVNRNSIGLWDEGSTISQSSCLYPDLETWEYLAFPCTKTGDDYVIGQAYYSSVEYGSGSNDDLYQGFPMLYEIKDNKIELWGWQTYNLDGTYTNISDSFYFKLNPSVLGLFNVLDGRTVPYYYLQAIQDYGYEEGYYSGHSDGYDDGLQKGRENWYQPRYDQGYADAKDTYYFLGIEDGYDQGYNEGEKYGWDSGFGAGQNDMAETTSAFKNMVFAIFDAPVSLIDGMLNFDIFGINMARLVKTIITLAVVALIVFVILKFAKG